MKAKIFWKTIINVLAEGDADILQYAVEHNNISINNPLRSQLGLKIECSRWSFGRISGFVKTFGDAEYVRVSLDIWHGDDTADIYNALFSIMKLQLDIFSFCAKKTKIGYILDDGNRWLEVSDSNGWIMAAGIRQSGQNCFTKVGWPNEKIADIIKEF